MNINPDPVTQRILSKHRGRVLERLRELELDGRSVLARAAVAIRDCKEHSARVAAMIAELRQADDTTRALPVLPPKEPPR